MTAEAAKQQSEGKSGDLSLGALSWSLFEGARNPYVILVTIYIFAPYIASTVVGDSVRGQEVISNYAQFAGWIVMATAPFLGAAVDELGKRKRWLALIVGIMCPLMATLWWLRPDGTGLSLGAAMLLIMIINVLFPYTEVLHNSLLVRAAGLRNAHKASGLALALGNLFAVFALAFTAYAFALPGKVDWGWVPREPLFGLDPAKHEPERIVAPLAAVIFAIGALPLFLFTPDAEAKGVSLPKAFADGAANIARMLRTIRGYRDAAIYLVSRMFFVDGMTAILFYYGIFASGVMHWGPLELLANGIILSVLAVLGGFVGRWMDGAFGPKWSLVISVGMSMLGILALLGMTPTQILYLWPYDPAAHAPLWNGPVFRTLPDVVFILIGFSNAVFITAQYASARTMLTRLTPPAQTGAFFGIYALSGTATIWLGSTTVNLGTRIFHSLQGGFGTIAVLLGIGFVGLLFVRGGGAWRETDHT
ncbi:MAG TPA: MFS transporter [Vitreimonas sp.]|nr:MFS transporter [Vitreimonas sp.]